MFSLASSLTAFFFSFSTTEEGYFSYYFWTSLNLWFVLWKQLHWCVLVALIAITKVKNRKNTLPSEHNEKFNSVQDTGVWILKTMEGTPKPYLYVTCTGGLK